MRAGVLVVVAACSAAPKPPPRPVEPARAVLPDAPFDELDRAQREQVMRERVVPAMQAVFARHDPNRRVGCTTCHGKRADAGVFVMPSPELPLAPDPARRNHAEAAWMTADVVPAMAELLGVPADRVGCPSCHTTSE